MSITVLVEANLKDNGAFDALMREILPDTRAYDGCEGLTIQRNLDDSANIVLVEHWESRAHYEKYLKWRDETGVLAKIGELIDGPPKIRMYSMVGV